MGKPANRLAELRDARGLTQEELAEKVGTTHATIGRMENGKRQLTSRWITKLAKALGCHPGELFEPLPAPDDDPDIAAIIDHARRLSPPDKVRFLEIGRVALPAPPAKPPRQRRRAS